MNKNKNIKIAVFCGSYYGDDPIYSSETKKLGIGIVKRNWVTIFGGSNLGLMGELANTVISEKGTIESISVKKLDAPSTKKNLPNLTAVDSLAKRKFLLISKAHFILALPGGVGTIDEIFEVLSMNALMNINKPLFLINVKNYWNPIIKLLENYIKKQFINKNVINNIHVFNNSYNTLKTIDEMLNKGIKK